MGTMNYKDVGLKIGLEIHRQIETHKLFCHCKGELEDSKPEHVLKRYLHDVSSETGEKDVVAAFEKSKKKYALYEVMDASSCAVETDEEPIHKINRDALDAVLEVALMLNCKIVNPIQIMRKQVLDLSNTSGFQRTALVALDGWLETKSGRVRISSVCVEEDSARRMKTEKDHVVFRLDRLGVPLIEIATEPDIKTPEQAQEVAAYLGMVLKSTGKFKAGLGTIRQDLNVSTKGHPRVEIKGMQDLKLIPTAVLQEIKRQQGTKNGKSEVRQVQLDGKTTFLRPMPGAARMYVETDHPLIDINEKELQKVKVSELLDEKIVKFEKKYKLSATLAREVVHNTLFVNYVNKFKHIEPNFIAKVLIELPKEMKSRLQVDSGKLEEKDYSFVLENVNKKTIPSSAVLEILVAKAKGEKVDLNKYKGISLATLEKEVKALVLQKKGVPPKALMGLIMGKYKGRVDGRKVMELLEKYSQ